MKESNSRQLVWRQLCYHYTNPLGAPLDCHRWEGTERRPTACFEAHTENRTLFSRLRNERVTIYALQAL